MERKSLIIFDEVQFQPLARQAIKSFVENHMYDYIETGSLISIRKNTAGIPGVLPLILTSHAKSHPPGWLSHEVDFSTKKRCLEGWKMA